MVIVMNQGASEPQVEHVIERLTELGFDAHRSSGTERTVIGAVGGNVEAIDPRELEILEGVKEVFRISKPYKLVSRSFRSENTTIPVDGVEIGGEPVVVMAGPCSIESEKQIHTVAEIVAKAGARVLRGGAFKPRTSPYSFQGLGGEGLRYMREAADANGLGTVSEVMDASQVELMSEYVDIFQVGARNMQNFALLKALGRTDKPVLLKRGLAATIEDLLMSAEYILAGGNHDVILCERGIRADVGRVHPRRRQPRRHLVRTRHPNLRDRLAQHLRHLRHPGGAAGDAPADHRRPQPRHRLSRQGRVDGAGSGGRRRRRLDGGGAPRSRQCEVRRAAVAVSRPVRGAHGAAAPDRAGDWPQHRVAGWRRTPAAPRTIAVVAARDTVVSASCLTGARPVVSLA